MCIKCVIDKLKPLIQSRSCCYYMYVRSYQKQLEGLIFLRTGCASEGEKGPMELDLNKIDVGYLHVAQENHVEHGGRRTRRAVGLLGRVQLRRSCGSSNLRLLASCPELRTLWCWLRYVRKKSGHFWYGIALYIVNIKIEFTLNTWKLSNAYWGNIYAMQGTCNKSNNSYVGENL